MAAELTALIQSYNGVTRDVRVTEAAPNVFLETPKSASLTIADEVKPLRSVTIIEPSKVLAAMMRDAVVRVGASRIDVLSSKQEALALKETLEASEKMKAAVAMIHLDFSTWYRVELGPYRTLGDAEKIRDFLRERTMDSIINTRTPQ